MKVAAPPRTHINDLHFDHKMWTNTLAFYRDETTIFEHRLEEVVARNTKTEAMAPAEHFQNQFIRQREVIDTYLHDIKIAEQALSDYALKHPVAINHKLFEDHTGMRENMEQFEKLYRELREEFMRYLTKWM